MSVANRRFRPLVPIFTHFCIRHSGMSLTPWGSRFRRVNQRQGALYASEAYETAIAELAFYRFLFFREAPGMQLPANPVEHTAFRLSVKCQTMLDLTQLPFSAQATDWLSPFDYSACQGIADQAREAGIQAIRYQSVRDPEKGANVVVLDPAALSCKEPLTLQTWHIFTRSSAVQATCEMPRQQLEFNSSLFEFDPRLAAST